jgi:hypothetical protein
MLSAAGLTQLPATGPANRSTLILAVTDDAGVPAEWMQQAKGELARIYREIGVDITWWSPDAPSPEGVPAVVPRNLLIVAVRRNAALLQDELPGNAMGIASGTSVERSRVAYVFFDRTEQFSPLYRGRFLGHFMAHELGHLLLPQYSHSPKGLMRAQWSREDLEMAQYGRLQFTPEQASLIRSKAAQLAERPGKR